MTPRILLHIGLEKTGTSSIQRFLTQNRRRLLDRHGIFYPTQRALFHNDTHSAIAAALVAPSKCEFLLGRSRPDIDHVALALRQAIRAAPRQLVLSSEHFSSRLDPDAVMLLGELLSPYPVEVLVYIRRQDQMALSAFSTQLRSGRRTWLKADEIRPDDPYFDYASLLEPWAKVFGHSRIRVRVFDPQRLHRGNPVSDFLSILGIEDLSGFHSTKPQNRSLNLAEASLVRLLNQRLPTWEESLHQGCPNSYHQAQHLRARILAEAASIPAIQDAPPLATLLPTSERTRILERFSHSNRRIARDYLDTPKLFDPIDNQDLSIQSSTPELPTRLTDAQLADILLGMGRRLQTLQSPRITTRILRRAHGLWLRIRSSIDPLSAA